MLKARATRRVITPRQLPTQLGGYSEGESAFRITSDLEVNCLVLTDDVETLVLITLDTLYVTSAVRDAVLHGLNDLQLREKHVFMAASHTHYAPAFDETKPLLGEPNLEYRDALVETVIQTVRDAYCGYKSPVDVTIASGSMEIGVNRRRKRWVRATRKRIEFNKVAMCPNPGGPIDPRTTVIALRTGGRTLAYIWSAACHPTGLADGGAVDSHWPGTVRSRLRKFEDGQAPQNAELPVLFLQGFSGDIRPPSGKRKAGPLSALATWLRLGRTFSSLDASEYALWSGTVGDHIIEVAGQCAAAADESTLDCERVEFAASDFALGGDGRPPVSFHALRIGPILIIGVSAEPVSAYAAQLRALSPGRHVIPVGCIDHVIGYWPTLAMFSEGGYEVTHHCRSFGISACNPDIERKVLEGFRELVGRFGLG